HFLREHPHDLLWVIGLSQLVPDRLVSLARYGGVGFHPTMLPRGRGRAPVAWTILLGERAAVNLFFLADQPDAGDIIIQREVPVMSDDYAEDLIARTNKVLAEVVMELAPAIKVGELPRTPQDHALATYYPRRTPDDGLVDWSHSTEAIYRLVRAAGRPYPGAFTYMRRHKVTIWRAQPASTEETAPHPPNAAPGTILCIRSPGTMHVQTGDGAIWLTETQVEGRSDAIDNHYAELFVPGARFATVTEGEHCQQ
ncbi:MAG: methionyl-tRNA formyltransferase, partial [Phycisphaerae bacterium]